MAYLKVMLVLQALGLWLALARLSRNKYPVRVEIEPAVDVVNVVLRGGLLFWTLALLWA